MGGEGIQMVAAPPGFTCWDGVSETTLEAALSPPAAGCIEADLIDERDWDVVFTRGAPGYLALAVTTQSAYRHSIVRAFIGAMASRTSLCEDLRVRIYSAVQEALMNAIFHGNLKIDPHLRDSLDGLLASQEAIELKLASPEVAHAMIRLEATWDASTVHVAVRDSGEGYDAGSPCMRNGHDMCDGASGRGLDILEAFSDGVQVLNGGTTIRLEFRR
jgi:anti-sigma regulatory factor (Ser/Thr protein kinase)